MCQCFVTMALCDRPTHAGCNLVWQTRLQPGVADECNLLPHIVLKMTSATCWKYQHKVTQCRKALGHTGTNALITEPLVVPTCSEEENIQRCISLGFTPCCVELVSFSTVSIHPDACTATSKEGSDQYGLGYLSPFSKERWEEWHRKYSLQSGIDY